MAATRLSDEQKTALVERYRAGAPAAELAAEFGCSAATVTRVVKTALSPADYELLKQGRGQGRGRGGRSAAAVVTAPPAEPDPTPTPIPISAQAPTPAPTSEAAEEDPSGVLAIDDADDFGDDSDADADADADGDADETFVTVPVMPVAVGGEQVECKPLEQADLPASAYMLVDKTVELEAKPLKEFPELGSLPPEEEERRALMLFANPRKAKQLCGRSQRVIKLPDPWVLHRTARYLVAQGITRVVVEGSLYALPGS